MLKMFYFYNFSIYQKCIKHQVLIFFVYFVLVSQKATVVHAEATRPQPSHHQARRISQNAAAINRSDYRKWARGYYCNAFTARPATRTSSPSTVHAKTNTKKKTIRKPSIIAESGVGLSTAQHHKARSKEALTAPFNPPPPPGW